jgi:hypothetical protein
MCSDSAYNKKEVDQKLFLSQETFIDKTHCLNSLKVEKAEKMAPTKRNLTRSIRLRKYGSVYRKIIQHEKNEKSGKEKKDSGKGKKNEKSNKYKSKHRSNKKMLNSYQNFVKQESKSEKDKKLCAKERLVAIAKEWGLKKRRQRRKRKE